MRVEDMFQHKLLLERKAGYRDLPGLSGQIDKKVGTNYLKEAKQRRWNYKDWSIDSELAFHVLAVPHTVASACGTHHRAFYGVAPQG